MITNILANIEASSPWGSVLLIIPLIIYVGFIVLVISLMVRLVRYISTAGKERKLLRMELGKLAEEVHQMREQRESTNKKSSGETQEP